MNCSQRVGRAFVVGQMQFAARVESAAPARRELPTGGAVPDDYVFE